ncbi:MAG: hypothetical protein ACI9C4_000616 [Paraglaciecola sp.]
MLPKTEQFHFAAIPLSGKFVADFGRPTETLYPDCYGNAQSTVAHHRQNNDRQFVENQTGFVLPQACEHQGVFGTDRKKRVPEPQLTNPQQKNQSQVISHNAHISRLYPYVLLNTLHNTMYLAQRSQSLYSD